MIELDKKESTTEVDSYEAAVEPTNNVNDVNSKQPKSNKLKVYGIVVGVVVTIGIILCGALNALDKNDIGSHNTTSNSTHSVTVESQVEEENNSLPNEENNVSQLPIGSKGLGEFTWVAMLGGGIIVMMLLMEAVKGGIQIATGESRSFAPVIAPMLGAVVAFIILFAFIHM